MESFLVTSDPYEMSQKRSRDAKNHILNSSPQNKFMTFNISISLSVNNKYAVVAFTNEFYIRWPGTYRGSSPYANFIGANFISAIFQNLFKNKYLA